MARWTYEQVSQAFMYVFAELSEAVMAGNPERVSEERMVAMNVAWWETLDAAGWTKTEWERAQRQEAAAKKARNGDGKGVRHG